MLSATRSFLLSCLQCSVLSYSVLSRIVLIRITCSENELRNPRTTVRVLTVCFLKDLPVACHRSGAKTSKIDAGGTLSTEQTLNSNEFVFDCDSTLLFSVIERRSII
ncbi:hypothetical protein HI914_06245 [Erysiphe necator]|nr:hypothetical protein HI914_06245 [Erysiphe necator]